MQGCRYQAVIGRERRSAYDQRMQLMNDVWRAPALALRQGAGLLRALAVEAAPWRARAKRRGRETVSGINAPLEIIRDRWGVPHCFAGSVPDALFALGYVHAQDRLWQLRWNRRAALGRLAEIAGPAALPADRLTRTLGFGRVAREAWDATGQHQRGELTPYIAGINAGAARTPTPFEAVMLEDRMQPWQATDSIAWGKLLSFLLAPAWEQQLLRARIYEQAGPEALQALDPPLPSDAAAATPPQAAYGRLAEPLDEALQGLSKLLGLHGAASNNWAIAGRRTASGRPILACDPHLNPVTPPHAYFAHLHCPEFDAAGATIPGLPGIVWGCNDQIAWGPTAAMQAMQIAVVEQLNADGDATRTPEGWAPIERSSERIDVRGYPSETLELRRSVHGPIVSALLAADRAPRFEPNRAISLYSTVLEPTQSGSAIVELMQAADWQSFSAAAQQIEDFNLAFAYADRSGAIGLRVSGAVPAGEPQALRFPVPGWLQPAEGGAPRAVLRGDDLPHTLEPANGAGGIVVSANNPLTPAGAMNFGAEFLDAWRAQRIGAQLDDDQTPQTRERSAAMQLDQYSGPLHAFAAQLLEADLCSGADRARISPLIAEIAAWDGATAPRSRPAAIVALSFAAYRRAALREILGADAGKLLSGLLAIPTLDLFGARAGSWVLQRLATHSDRADADLASAFGAALRQLQSRFGPDSGAWTWGACRPLLLPHALAEAPLIGALLSAGPWPFGGDADSIAQSGVLGLDPAQPASAIPALRLIVELTDPPQAEFVLAGEQASDALHPAGAMTDAWLQGRRLPLLRDRAAIQRERPRRLQLQPRWSDQSRPTARLGSADASAADASANPPANPSTGT